MIASPSTIRMTIAASAVIFLAIAAACEVSEPLAQRRLEPAVTTVETSWMGNPLGAAEGTWVPRTLSGLAVTRQGKLFWMGQDDRGVYHDSRIVESGQIVGSLAGLRCCGRRVGRTAVADDDFVYAMVDQHRPDDVASGDFPDDKMIWRTIRRYDHKGKPVPFAAGRGDDHSLLIVSEDEPLTGMAFHLGELFVSHGTDGGTITVVDAASMTVTRTMKVSAPGALTVDGAGTLWVVQRPKQEQPVGAIDDSQASIGHFNLQGDPLPGRITDAGWPVALAMDASGRLLVADNGARQQVLAYRILGDATDLVQTYGIEGGLHASAGADVRPERFFGLSAVAADDEGVIYVGMQLAFDGAPRLVALSGDGETLWTTSSTTTYETATVDPRSDGRDVYTGQGRFRMDYSQPPGRQAQLMGWTLDWLRFPQDARVWSEPYVSPAIVYLQDRRFLFDLVGRDRFRIFRFEEGSETAIPAVVVDHRSSIPPAMQTEEHPESDVLFWLDSEGDGAMSKDQWKPAPSFWSVAVDGAGTVWLADRKSGLWRVPFAGLNEHGVPLYKLGEGAQEKRPEPFVDILAIRPHPETDSMYVGGYTRDFPSPYTEAEWTTCGSEIARYDQWDGKRKLRWRTYILLDEDIGHGPVDFAVAGNRVFITYKADPTIWVLDADTGQSVGSFSAGPEVSSWLAASRTRHPLRAFQRENGEYLLFLADAPHSKVTIFRLPPNWKG